MSLVRPSASYHTKGHAVDISRFAGHDILMTDPARALQGVLAVIDALPAGCYALGLPRPVRAEAAGARLDSVRYYYLNLYQAGSPPTLRPEYADLPRQNNSQAYIDHSPSRGNITRDLEFIVDAAAQFLLTTAIANARQRGARIKYLFPMP